MAAARANSLVAGSLAQARQIGPNRTARAQRPPSSITRKSIARSRSARTGAGVILIPNAQLAATKATIREVISQILKNTSPPKSDAAMQAFLNDYVPNLRVQAKLPAISSNDIDLHHGRHCFPLGANPYAAAGPPRHFAADPLERTKAI